MTEALTQNKRIIASLWETFSRLEDLNDISSIQRDIWDKLDALKTALIEARVMSGENDEHSFWDIMEPTT